MRLTNKMQLVIVYPHNIDISILNTLLSGNYFEMVLGLIGQNCFQRLYEIIGTKNACRKVSIFMHFDV